MAVTMLGLPACDGDSSSAGGPGKFSSGVDGSKSLDSLDEADQKKFCDAAEAWGMQLQSSGFFEKLCKMTAAFSAFSAEDDAQARMQCQMAYDECLMDDSSGGDPGMCDVPKCSVTVAKYESCLNMSMSAFSALANQLPSCDKLTKSSLTNLKPPTISEECQTITDECGGGP